ncbi:hypothetical protein [Streptosporangium roseum]|uniref:hypothetical protein n=1 Tax=Streptosporangium roseum TaxID=2001 RepID=UPI0033258798
MPNQPKTPTRNVRVEGQKWQDFGNATQGQGTNRAEAINQFIDWYLNKPGAELPERPPAAD